MNKLQKDKWNIEQFKILNLVEIFLKQIQDVAFLFTQYTRIWNMNIEIVFIYYSIFICEFESLILIFIYYLRLYSIRNSKCR